MAALNRLYTAYDRLREHRVPVEWVGHVRWPGAGERSTWALLGEDLKPVSYHCQKAAAYHYVPGGHNGDPIKTGLLFTVRYNTIFANTMPVLDLVPHPVSAPVNLDEYVVTTINKLYIPSEGWMRMRRDAASQKHCKEVTEALHADLSLIMAMVPMSVALSVYEMNQLTDRKLRVAVPKLIVEYAVTRDAADAVSKVFGGVTAAPPSVSNDLASVVCAHRALTLVNGAGNFGVEIALGIVRMIKDSTGEEFPMLPNIRKWSTING